MATIHNTDLTKELKDGGKLQQLRDVIPSQLADKVVPVMEVNPKLLRRSNIVRSGGSITAGSATIYTTPGDKDFYLTACSASFIKDAANDNATGRFNAIVATVEGIAQNLISFAVLTLTAQQQTVTISFPTPIKIDKNTAISIASTTIGAGSFAKYGNIVGYTVDNINA